MLKKGETKPKPRAVLLLISYIACHTPGLTPITHTEVQPPLGTDQELETRERQAALTWKSHLPQPQAYLLDSVLCGPQSPDGKFRGEQKHQ